MDSIVRRVQKLRERVALDKGAEADNARRLLEKIMDEYMIDDESLQEKQEYPIRYHLGMRDAIARLALALDIHIYSYKSSPAKIYIKATEAEYGVFMECLASLKRTYNALYNKKMLEIRSYIYGLVKSSYPEPEDKPVLCPECGAAMEYADRRYACAACGYKGRKLRGRDVDYKAFAKGASDGKRLIEKKS
jgi:ribosomal protein L37E